MPKEELEEWLLEDMASAQEWLSDRAVRRDNERRQDAGKIVQQTKHENLLKKQQESLARVLAKHKELNDKESEKTKILIEIFTNAKEDLLSKENGPELAAAEMERRLSEKENPVVSEDKAKIAELSKQLEDLQAKIQSIENDDEGVNSVVKRGKRDEKGLTDPEKRLIETLRDLKTPEANIQSALKKFREKKG
jgi:hypothetical protein